MMPPSMKGSRETPVCTANSSVPVFPKKNTHTHRSLIYDLKNLYAETSPGPGTGLACRERRQQEMLGMEMHLWSSGVTVAGAG